MSGIGSASFTSAISSMTNAYNAAQQSEAVSLQRVATGKQFSTASQDPTDFVSLVNAQTNQATYDAATSSLTTGSSIVSSALSAASDLMNDLQTLASDYATNTATSNANATSVLSAIKDKVAATDSNGKKILNPAYTTVSSVKAGGTISVNLQTLATTAVAAAGGGATMVTGTTETTAAGVTNSINGLTAYINSLSGLQAQITSEQNFSKVASANSQAYQSSLTQVDQASELANETAQDIQEQAAASMLSQANTSSRNILLLYK